MDGESFISPIVELLREILYDILGLFFPGAALIIVLKASSIQAIHRLVTPLTGFETGTKLALFIGASYVLGYAIQGFAGRFWGWVVVRLFCGKPVPETKGMKGISPAFRQVVNQLATSDLFHSFEEQAKTYCGLTGKQLSLNEVQSLAYSIAWDRVDNAFTFSFRADLANGVFMVFVVAIFVTLFEYGNLTFSAWLGTLIIYTVLAAGFALRAWTYYSIRGRIVYSIGMAALADINKGKQP